MTQVKAKIVITDELRLASLSSAFGHETDKGVNCQDSPSVVRANGAASEPAFLKARSKRVNRISLAVGTKF
ncbi:hypothetical protein DRO66_08625 [Candidatus Bathyarchaeota archaeon]|nr:MAG: hypothetical protein DRO66_08625 [Candidatus Bathyarchaeota archaeon]